MKSKIYILLLAGLLISMGAMAQDDKADRKEDRDEKTTERKATVKDKTDYGLFHRQMLSLKEYSEERRKIPALQKANKTVVKVVTVIDSADDDAKKTITGYIVQNIGDNSVNLYEVTYDRAQKKIISVKRTADAAEAEKADKEDKADKAEDKTEAKKATHKKAKDEDEDDDDDDKPAKGKDKDKDED